MFGLVQLRWFCAGLVPVRRPRRGSARLLYTVWSQSLLGYRTSVTTYTVKDLTCFTV